MSAATDYLEEKIAYAREWAPKMERAAGRPNRYMLRELAEAEAADKEVRELQALKEGGHG